jgi:hypothetical protein
LLSDNLLLKDKVSKLVQPSKAESEIMALPLPLIFMSPKFTDFIPVA